MRRSSSVGRSGMRDAGNLEIAERVAHYLICATSKAIEREVRTIMIKRMTMKGRLG